MTTTDWMPLAVIGGLLWWAGRSKASAGGVVSSGKVSSVSLGALLVKDVGTSLTGKVNYTILTMKAGGSIKWNYALSFQVRDPAAPSVPLKEITLPLTALAGGSYDQTFGVEILPAWAGKTLDVYVWLFASKPKADLTPDDATFQEIGKKIVSGAFTVPTVAVTTSGSVNSVALSQRRRMAVRHRVGHRISHYGQVVDMGIIFAGRR